MAKHVFRNHKNIGSVPIGGSMIDYMLNPRLWEFIVEEVIELSLWPLSMAKKLLRSQRSKREQAEWAYGLWLASPQSTSASKFISNITGIPRDEVWGILLGKRTEND